MNKVKTWRNSFISAALFVGMISIWVLFAPMQFGGNTAYVILSGNSMSPKFWQGDLVLVRKQAAYQIGDAVAYEHPQIGYVFHRIIDIDIHRKFTLQGDHNDWTDSYYPSQEDIVGKLWLHIPQLGKTLQSLRSPWGFAILVLVFSIFFVSVQGGGTKLCHYSNVLLRKEWCN